MDNEIIDDCKYFAEKHRGTNKQSGPYWSTIIRFPKLFDEAVRLLQKVDELEFQLKSKKIIIESKEQTIREFAEKMLDLRRSYE